MIKNKLKSVSLGILISYGGLGVSSNAADPIGTGAITSILDGGLNLDGLIGEFLNFGIPGVGRVKLSCDIPDFNIDGLDFCSLADGIGLKIPSIPSFDLNIGGCEVGLGLGNDMSPEACQRKMFKSFCSGGSDKTFSLSDYKNGIGTNASDAESLLGAIGGKGIFGKDVCANDPKRYKKINSASYKKIYGKNGYAQKALFDKSIGGSPRFLNSRRTASMLRCMEVAEENSGNIEECYLNAEKPGSEKKDYEINEKIAKKAKYDMGPIEDKVEGKYGEKADKYWKLFATKSKEKGITDWKLLMAIGMVESDLNPTAIGAPNKDGSRDYGMMQVNSRWHKKAVNERYGAYGGFWQALNIPEVAVDYGAKVFSDCTKKYGENWMAVDCYNKGGNAHFPSAYAQKVQQEYQKLGGKDFGDADSPYQADVKISQRMAAFAALSFIAVQHERTMTHLGMDTVDLLPIDKKKRYIEMVDRYIAQKTLVLAAYKKAADIEKAVYHIQDYGSGVSAGPALPGSDSSSPSSPSASSVPALPGAGGTVPSL